MCIKNIYSGCNVCTKDTELTQIVDPCSSNMTHGEIFTTSNNSVITPTIARFG